MGDKEDEPLTYPDEVPVERWVPHMPIAIGQTESKPPLSDEEFQKAKGFSDAEMEEYRKKARGEYDLGDLGREDDKGKAVRRWRKSTVQRARWIVDRLQAAGEKLRRRRAGIRPFMTEDEIRTAGLAIDVPFEAGSADPQPLRYSDGMTFEEKFPELFKPYYPADKDDARNATGGSAVEQPSGDEEPKPSDV